MQHRHRNRLPATAAALLAVLLTACGGAPTAAETATEAAGGTASGTGRLEPLPGPPPEPHLPATVESADGQRVTVTRAERIVPLSGSLAEIVFTLGLGERVVARDVTATFPAAEALPVVTRGHQVSAEGVLSLKPDAVLVEDTTGPAEAIEQIRAAGVPVIVFAAPDELEDVPARIGAVAATLGVPGAGQELTERTAQRLAEARRTVPDTGSRPRVAFLYVRGSASVYLLGGAESGAVSLIEAAGGVDAGKESGLAKDFTPLTSEALAAAAPQVILVMTAGLESVGGVDGLLDLPGVAQTPAGMDRRVAVIEDGVLLNYGPRTDAVVADLAAQFHTGHAG